MHLPAARFLERTLLFNFLIHALAMIAMPLLLMSAIPGGGVPDISQRVAAVALHPWRFRLGWFPWQLTALADLLLAVALVRTRWIPRVPASFTLIVTLAAVIPDQTGQFLWITRGIDLAREAVRSGETSTYLAFETATFKLIAGWGTVGYLAGAIGWTWCFAAAGTWSRALTWLSVATWGIFAVATAIFFLPARLQPNPLLIGAGNAVGFVLLEIWLIAVTERVLARSRPSTMHGRGAPWRSCKRGMIGDGFDWLANSAFLRATAELLPAPALASDIRDVVYVNYLVKAEKLERFTPPGLQLQRIGPESRWTVFTFLTYRHGHFGPRALGPLRKLMPSPIQSNWRLYVIDPRTKHAGVYFVTTAISSMIHALAGRMLSEGVPMHVWREASLNRRSDGSIQIALDPGDGSAPDARIDVRPTDQGTLPAPWCKCFADYLEMLKFIVPQDRALSPQTWYARICRQEINLGIPLETIVPLIGDVKSASATEMLGAQQQPLCFYVPRVSFRFDRETFDPITTP
jgi:hypothetical protein